jgi:hypothetical protein
MPGGLAQRALQVARGSTVSQSAGKARFPARRQGIPPRTWIMRVASAAIALVVLIGLSWAVKAVNSRLMWFPPPASRGVVGASFAGGEPTVWIFSQAARQSPESLDALLDRQLRRPNTATTPPGARSADSQTGGSRKTTP